MDGFSDRGSIPLSSIKIGALISTTGESHPYGVSSRGLAVLCTASRFPSAPFDSSDGETLLRSNEKLRIAQLSFKRREDRKTFYFKWN